MGFPFANLKEKNLLKIDCFAHFKYFLPCSGPIVQEAMEALVEEGIDNVLDVAGHVGGDQVRVQEADDGGTFVNVEEGGVDVGHVLPLELEVLGIFVEVLLRVQPLRGGHGVVEDLLHGLLDAVDGGLHAVHLPASVPVRSETGSVKFGCKQKIYMKLLELRIFSSSLTYQQQQLMPARIRGQVRNLGDVQLVADTLRRALAGVDGLAEGIGLTLREDNAGGMFVYL